MNTPEQYQQLWDSMELMEVTAAHVLTLAGKIKANKPRYDTVSAATSVPWAFIGVIHNMECDLSFHAHLHNGDPLTARTVHVPAGRPVTGNPPFTWEFSAEDALRYMGYDKITDWSVPSMLLHLEKYNGGGYAKRGINTPYLWSATNHYGLPPNIGKYTSDGKFDPNAISNQIGAAALLKQLI